MSDQVGQFGFILHGVLRVAVFAAGLYVIFHFRNIDQNAASLADMLGVVGLIFLLWVWGESVRGRWR